MSPTIVFALHSKVVQILAAVQWKEVFIKQKTILNCSDERIHYHFLNMSAYICDHIFIFSHELLVLKSKVDTTF